MTNTLTLGTIWKDSNNREFELTAISKFNNLIQLSSIVGEQVYRCLTEESLRKNYQLVALSLRNYKPELTVVTTD